MTLVLSLLQEEGLNAACLSQTEAEVLSDSYISNETLSIKNVTLQATDLQW